MLQDHTIDDRWKGMLGDYNISTTDYDPNYVAVENKKCMDAKTEERVISREAFRQVLVQAFDENKDYNAKSPFEKHVLDLQKRIIISSFSNMSDESFNKMMSSEGHIEKLVELADNRIIDVLIKPLEIYPDSKEFEAEITAKVEPFVSGDKFQGLDEKAQKKLLDEMSEQWAENLLEDKLKSLSALHTKNLIKEVSAAYEAYFE